MKNDILNTNDIQLLIETFYGRVKNDPLLGPVFNDIAQLKWDEHFLKMNHFWENIIFQTGDYQGNPMNLHQKLNLLSPLTDQHFERWNKLFIETITELFEGKNVVTAISKTISISEIIRQKTIKKTREN